MHGAIRPTRDASIDPLFGWVPPDRTWVPSVRYLLRRDRVLGLLSQRQPGQLLEIGCGAGSLLVDLAMHGYRCIGLETSDAALRLARLSLDQSSVPDITVVSTEDASWAGRFSTLVALDVLEHIADDFAAVKQWGDWLAPGGILLVSVPAHGHRWGSGDVWAGHFRRYGRQALVEVVRAAGLEVQHIECYGYPYANITEWLGEPYYRKALAARPDHGTAGREHGNSQSGIERRTYRRAYAAMTSIIGRALLKIGLLLQRGALRTDWGSGYILVARKA